MSKKPVILNDFEKVTMDEVDELIARNRQQEEAYDPYYIPGWTEQRKANEIGEADEFTWMDRHQKTGIKKGDVYKIIGKEPRPLPVFFRALRVAGVTGATNGNVTSDLMPYQRWGYRPAHYPNDFTQYGYGQPPGFTVHQDGSLHRDDLQLFVVDGRAERAWQESLAREAAERENPPEKVMPDGQPIIRSTANYTETVNFGKEE